MPRAQYPSGLGAGAPMASIASGAQPCMPAPPWGAAGASTRRQIAAGRISAISWATKPPIENPRTSTLENSIA